MPDVILGYTFLSISTLYFSLGPLVIFITMTPYHHINLLWKYRKLMGYTQKEVGNKIGVDPILISRWERGAVMPSSINLLKLSVLYKTLPNELYKGLVRKLQKDLYGQPNNKDP